MAGILANSASVTMVAGSVDNTQAGFVVGEAITLSTTPTGTDYSWGVAKPSGATSRSDLSDDDIASPVMIPDVAGTYTITCDVDGTDYTLRITVTAVAVTSVANAHRFSPVTNTSVPTPALGESVFYSSTDSRLSKKNTSGTVLPIAGGTLSYGGIYVSNGSTAQTGIGTSYTKITGFTTNAPSTSDITPDHTTDSVTIAIAGMHVIHLQCSFSGSANTTFTVSMAVDGVEQEHMSFQRKLSGGDVGSASFIGHHAMASGEALTCLVKADGSDKSFTPVFMHFGVHLI
jgi:hypothetical protein